jgi:hypothetical protein
LTNRFSTATSLPVTLNIKQADDGTQILATQGDKDNPLLMERRLSLVITPTINNDDTITIFITGGVNAELTHQKPVAKNDLIWVERLDNAKGMTTVCTIHNGGSLLFAGYNSTMLGLDSEHHPIVFQIKAEIEK